MTECELCGGTENLFVGHYEEHIEPPRNLTICRRCHSRLVGHEKGKNTRVLKAINGPNSLMLTIPKRIQKALGIDEEDYFIVRMEGKRIIYEPLDVK